MSTRTAIFQEQKDGTYLGIYIHQDGDIQGVGKLLETHYKDRNKVAELINNKLALSFLGVENTILTDRAPFGTLKAKKGKWHKYCRVRTGSKNEYSDEYYIAQSKEEIISGKYLTYNSKDEIQGFTPKSGNNPEFIPFRGSDNNGFYYIQDLNGTWLESHAKSVSKYGGRTMTPFQPIQRLAS